MKSIIVDPFFSPKYKTSQQNGKTRFLSKQGNIVCTNIPASCQYSMYKQEALDTVLYANHDGKRAVRVLKSHAKQIFSSLLLRDYNYILVYGVCQTEKYVFNLIRPYYNTQNLLYHVEMLMVNTFCSVCISLTQKHPIFVRINLLLFHLI